MSPTQKQIEIVLLVSSGYTSKQIAELLRVSPLTVDNHRKTALKNSAHVTWSQFMAEAGMSGQLREWKEGYEVRNGAIVAKQKINKNDFQ